MSYLTRDILSLRLENRARLLRMVAHGEVVMPPRELRAELLHIAEQLDADARAAGRLEQRKGCSE